MSLLLSPLLLFLLGMGVARVAKMRRVWRRHGRFPRRALAFVLGIYSVVSLALLIDHRSMASWVRWLPGETGTAWMINSGVLHLDAAWPLADPWVLVFCIVAFMLFPFWLYLGWTAGCWLFGTNPRQTGVLGLLR